MSGQELPLLGGLRGPGILQRGDVSAAPCAEGAVVLVLKAADRLMKKRTYPRTENVKTKMLM